MHWAQNFALHKKDPSNQSLNDLFDGILVPAQDALCVVHDALCVVQDSLCVVRDALYMVRDSLCLVPDALGVAKDRLWVQDALYAARGAN